MHRIPLILSLFTLLVAVALRKLNGDRILHGLKDTKLSIKAGDMARSMLDSVSHDAVEVKTPARRWAASADVGKDWLVVPREVSSGVSAQSHGKAALMVGLYLLFQRDPKAVARRQWAVKFGHVFPIFTTMVVIFAMLVAKLGGLWCVAIILASCGIATWAQLLALGVERKAAALATVLIEKKRIFPRLSDEEAVIAATSAHAWRSIMPGILARLVP